MQPALIALATAFLLDIAFGDPPNAFHPVVAMGNLIRYFISKWNTGSNTRRFWAGTGLIIFGGALFSLPWLAVDPAIHLLPVWSQGILVGFFLKPTIAFRGLLRAGREVQKALSAGDLVNGRRLVAWHLVSRDTSCLSDRQVASATIESLAENLTDSFFAPLLCFVVGGLPLAWFYRYINTADAMIGYHSLEFEYFGKCAARLDDVINWLPARLAGFIIIISAGLCHLDIKSAYKTMQEQHSQTSSPNAGWTMAASAGALRVILEKSGNYRLEGGSELPDLQDIKHAMRLITVSLILSLFVCGGFIVGIQSFF